MRARSKKGGASSAIHLDMDRAGTRRNYGVTWPPRNATGICTRKREVVRVVAMFFQTLILGACVTLSPEGSRVAVFNAPLNAAAAKRTMPSGCRLLSSRRPFYMSELDLYGQRDPFRAE